MLSVREKARHMPDLEPKPSGKAHGGRWARRAIVAVCAAAAVAFAAAKFAPYLTDGDEYADVVSIETTAAYRDPSLMAKAGSLPVAAAYGPDMIYQNNPSFCGPTTIANLLRSLGVARTQEEVLAKSSFRAVFGLLIGGLTLDEEAALMTSNTAGKVEILRDLDLEEFRAAMTRVNDPAARFIVNFHRGPMFGRGHGHFSPLLAYLAEEDLVLVGDVNADYGPYLVSAELLWMATDSVDGETGLERGLIVFTPGAD